MGDKWRKNKKNINVVPQLQRTVENSLASHKDVQHVRVTPAGTQSMHRQFMALFVVLAAETQLIASAAS